MKPYRIYVRRDVRQEINFSEVADTLPQARDLVAEMAGWEQGHDDDTYPFVDDEDELLIVDVDGHLVMAWKNGKFVDNSTIGPFELPAPYFIGMDVTDEQGKSIFGTDLDPWGLKASDLLRNDAAEAAKEWVKDNPGFHVASRFQGDVREETVYHVMPSECTFSP